MKQASIQTFGKPPLPKGYSTSHILTYRKCEYKFLLAYIYKVKVETKFKPLLLGSDVHSDISKGQFISEDPDKQKMLDVARQFLSVMPSNPVFETEISDKDNPGTFKGYIFDVPFMGIFDVHWPDDRIGADWKTGKFHEEYKNDYEIQAYVLNELFKQKYKRSLRKFVFVFLKDGVRYETECIANEKARLRKEKMIKGALASIRSLKFEKKVSFACQWCDYQGMCI
jgi:hypothetical protein